MNLCLSDAKQLTASTELINAYKFSETVDCLWRWKARHNTKPSKCITKFITDDRQYS